MPNVHDKVVLITGATSGIGLEASVKLARMGYRIVLVARDAAKGEAAALDVRTRSGNAAVSYLVCDFSSQAAIRNMAAEFRKAHSRLDLLINNAGSVFAKYGKTVDGIELTFAINHLGYFLTTRLLLDVLEQSAPGVRIVNVASAAHRRATMDLADLQFEKTGYSILRAYGRSKLANVLFTRELARRLAGKDITVNCLHPGVVATRIWTHAPLVARPFLALYKRIAMVTPEEGADRIVFLATSPSVEGQTGGYYVNDRRVEPQPLGQNEALARRLWDESAKLVNLD